MGKTFTMLDFFQLHKKEAFLTEYSSFNIYHIESKIIQLRN